MLSRYALDRTFEKYGGFITIDPCEGVTNPDWVWGSKLERWIDGPRLYPKTKAVRFGGNFLKLSHGFSIDTNDPETIAKLTAAIEVNMKFSDYSKQEAP